MDLKDNKNETEKLSNILSMIQNIYYKKKEQLEQLKSEIDELRQVLNSLNSILSGKSFHSADEIYSKKLLEKAGISSEDQYFVEELPKEKVEGTNIKRKIFSKRNDKEDELLCVLNFYDFNKIEIKIINPEKMNIKETSEDFIKTFLKGALIKIKETNPNMNLKYAYFKNTDIIEHIAITNLKSITEYDVITSKMRELLAKEVSQNH
ncbi:MAG: hypothetical protein ACFE91_09590 [Promethearchaeota archaeon]